MLIGICGGICAGKRSVADYLIAQRGFKPISLSSQPLLDDTQPSTSPASLKDSLCFSAVDSLLDFVTPRWRQNWVIVASWPDHWLEALLRRPFFLLVSVDAPLSLRWKRFQDRNASDKAESSSLESFVEQNDQQLYGSVNGLAQSVDRAQMRLLNSSDSIDGLCRSLQELDLLNPQRLRPSWDQYFMQLASLASQRSNCMKRRVGCVLVRDHRVISTGYNGTPRNITNCNAGGCPRCNGGQGAGVGLSTCLCIHAEENALLEAGRERIREGSILYCDTCPCLTCSIKITQVGISEVVYRQSYSMDSEAATIFQNAGLSLRQFSPPREGVVDLGSISSDGCDRPSSETPI